MLPRSPAVASRDCRGCKAHPPLADLDVGAFGHDAAGARLVPEGPTSLAQERLPAHVRVRQQLVHEVVVVRRVTHLDKAGVHANLINEKIATG